MHDQLLRYECSAALLDGHHRGGRRGSAWCLRDQDRELLQEFDAAEDERAGTVGPGLHEGEAYATVRKKLDTLLGQRWAQEIVPESFQRAAILGADGAMTTVLVTRDATLGDAESLFEKHDFNLHRWPRGGPLLGIVTKLGLLRAFDFTTESIVPHHEEITTRPATAPRNERWCSAAEFRFSHRIAP